MAVDSAIFLGHIVSYFRKIQNLKAVVYDKQRLFYVYILAFSIPNSLRFLCIYIGNIVYIFYLYYRQ